MRQHCQQLTYCCFSERNPKFLNQALDAVGGDKQKKMVVVCDIGGTLKTYVERTGPKAKKFNDPERLFGRQSRFSHLPNVFGFQTSSHSSITFKQGVPSRTLLIFSSFLTVFAGP